MEEIDLTSGDQSSSKKRKLSGSEIDDSDVKRLKLTCEEENPFRYHFKLPNLVV